MTIKISVCLALLTTALMFFTTLLPSHVNEASLRKSLEARGEDLDEFLERFSQTVSLPIPSMSPKQKKEVLCKKSAHLIDKISYLLDRAQQHYSYQTITRIKDKLNLLKELKFDMHNLNAHDQLFSPQELESVEHCYNNAVSRCAALENLQEQENFQAFMSQINKLDNRIAALISKCDRLTAPIKSIRIKLESHTPVTSIEIENLKAEIIEAEGTFRAIKNLIDSRIKLSRNEAGIEQYYEIRGACLEHLSYLQETRVLILQRKEVAFSPASAASKDKDHK